MCCIFIMNVAYSRRMTQSILKSDASNKTSPHNANLSAPVSVVVDVVNHDEPSVSSIMSNGGAQQQRDTVSVSNL